MRKNTTTLSQTPTTTIRTNRQPVRGHKIEPVEIVSAEIEAVWLKALIDKRKLNQEEVARRVGISYRQMNRLTLGHSDPSLLLATRIAVVLDVDVNDLFTICITTRPRVERP